MAEKNLKIGILLDFYRELLSSAQSEALHQYYNEDLSAAEIAENLGITRQGVYENLKRGEELLLGFEEALGLSGKFSRISASLAKIENEAEALRTASSDIDTHREKITALVKKIAEELR